MFCRKCGSEIGQVSFCPNCGESTSMDVASQIVPVGELFTIRPDAKFTGRQTTNLRVINGDFKSGDWGFWDGKLSPALSFKSVKVDSNSLEHFEVLKEGLDFDNKANTGAGTLVGFMAGGLVGAMVGEQLAGNIKNKGTVIRFLFKDGREMVAIADGATMARLFAASERKTNK